MKLGVIVEVGHGNPKGGKKFQGQEQESNPTHSHSEETEKNY